MDAIKYVKAQKRMFLSGNLSVTRMMEDTMDPELLVNDVERWAAAHPSKTRQELFLEQYPDAQVDIDDILCVCPAVISPLYRNDRDGCSRSTEECANCRYKFWSEEVE